MMKTISKLFVALALLTAPLFAQNAQGGFVNFLAPENVVNWANNNSNGGCLYRVGPLSATGNGSAFTPLQNIYADKLFASVISQASGISCPPNGRIKFYAPFGSYIIQYQFVVPSVPAGAPGAGSQFYNDVITVGPAGALGAYQGVASVGITDTNFHALIVAGSDILIPANTLQVQGKKLHIVFDGNYTNAAASLLNAEVMICTVSGCGSGTVVAPAGCAIVSTNQANNLTNGQFEGDCTFTTTATLGAAGTVMAKGRYGFNLGAATSAVDSLFSDTANAVSATFDETNNEFINIAFKFSSSNAGNSAILNSASVVVEN